VRLADRVAPAGFRGLLAEDPDGLGQGIEDRGSRDVLNHVLPPALRIVVPGDGRQFADRIDTRPRALILRHRELMSGRQVTEPDRYARVKGVPDRLPLR
jgi:hypothetical protein